MKRFRPPARQRGIVSILAAILLFAGVIYWLQQTYGIIGNTSQSNATQLDSVKAFFLAESGLERGLGQLKAAPDPTLQSACATDIPGTYTLATGETFTLSASAGGCDTSVPPTNCTSCTVTSTGSTGTASRKIQSVISLNAPSGGAYGCGGGGSAGTCPVSGIPTSDYHEKITQAIDLDPGRWVLFSAMGFARHPAGSTNNVDGNTCIEKPGGGSCITLWDTESNHSAGSTVVGSRGSAIVLNPTVKTTYELTQTLTYDSLFAAIGARFGGTGATYPRIVGQYDFVYYNYSLSTASYWDDASGNGSATVAGNTTASGKTNDGTACSAPNAGTCPNGLVPPNPPTYSTKQTDKNWCYGADTLVFGFTGKSATNNNGALTSFNFGTSPASADIGSVAFPKPDPGAGTNSELYTSLRYVYNPDFGITTPPGGGSAGATSFPVAVAGTFGASFTGTLHSVSGNGYLCVPNTLTLSTGGAGVGDRVWYDSGGANPLPNQGGGNRYTHVQALITPATNCVAGESEYSLVDNVSAVTNKAFHAESRKLNYTGITPIGGSLTVGSSLDLPDNTALGTVSGSSGNYLVSNYNYYPTATYFKQGTSTGTITLPSGSPAPSIGMKVAVYSGAGALDQVTILGNTFSSWKSVTGVGTNTFTVASVSSPIIGATICGGICAYFNHDTLVNSGQTDFTITFTSTNQWAAGITCLSGVNTSTIEALKASTAGVMMTNWHEVVH